MRAEGVVFKVYDKQFPGKPMTYSIKLDGQPLFFRAGTNRYAGIAESGNRVAFDYTPNADGKSGNITGPVTLAAAPAPAASGSVGFVPSGERQNSIVYQSSRKDAIELVKLILSTEAIAVPAKKADRLEFIEALVDHYTATMFEDVNTLGAVTRENEGGGVPSEGSNGEDDGE